MIGRSNAVSGGGIEWKDGVEVTRNTISLPFYPYNGETGMFRWDGVSEAPGSVIIPLDINSTTAHIVTSTMVKLKIESMSTGSDLTIGNGDNGTVEITVRALAALWFPEGATVQYAIVD